MSVLNSDNHYERQYACKQCEFFTNNPRSILYHRKEFHCEKINVHECQYCQYASQYSGKVERHTMLRHKIDIANGGTIAPAVSSSQSLSLSQQQAVDDVDDEPIEDGKNSSTAAAAVAAAAANVARFQCNKCPCKYKRSSDLSKHLKLKHAMNSNHLNVYSECVELNSRNGNQSLNNGYTDEIENDENDEEFYGETSMSDSRLNTTTNNNSMQQTSTNSASRNLSAAAAAAAARNFNQLNQKKVQASPSSSSQPSSQPTAQPLPRRIAMAATAHSSSSSSSSGNPYQLQCPYCTYTANLSTTANAKSDYLVHVKDHLCGKAFRCVLCNSVYKYRGDCVVHLKRKHQKADMIAHSYVDKFNLDLLDASQIYGLLKPKQQDEPENEEKLFGCAYCDYKANYKGDVYKHQTRRHPGTMKQVNVLATHHSFNGGANQSLNGSNVLANCSNQSSANNSANNSFNHGMNDDLGKYSVGGSGGNKFYQHTNENGARFYNNSNNGHQKPTQNGNRVVSYQQQQHQHQDEQENGEEENGYYNNEDEENMLEYENNNEEEDEDGMMMMQGGEGGELMGEEDEDEINYEGEENFVDGEEAAAPLDDADDVDEDEEDFFNERQQQQQQQQQQHFTAVNRDMMGSRYQCKFCTFVAKSHAKLKLHLATHYNLKKFMCPICKRRANFKWDIQKHMRKIHNDFTSEVIVLSEIEARKSIDNYMETTNANGGRMLNGVGAQTDAQSDHSSSTTTTTIMSENTNHHHNHNHHHRAIGVADSGIERQHADVVMYETGKTAVAASASTAALAGNGTGIRPPPSNGSSVNYASSSSSSIASQQQLRSNNLPQSSGNFNMLPSFKNDFGSPNNSISAAFMGSDTTGNKKFRCTICPYRSNWKADLYRHLRKRHGMQQPSIDDVIVLSSDEAANTLEEYERIYGVNVRKRARFDAIAAAAAAAAVAGSPSAVQDVASAAADSLMTSNECKRMRTTDSSSVISTSTSGSHSSKAFEPKYINSGAQQENYMGEEDDYNQTEQMDHQQQLIANNSDQASTKGGVERLPVSIAELNIKPYKCLKCGFRSDRKSDTLRHIRVKHELEPLHAFKFLRIMSIKEASETIDEYESTRLFRKSTSRATSRDYSLINSLVVSQSQSPASANTTALLNRSIPTNMSNMSPRPSITVNRAVTSSTNLKPSLPVAAVKTTTIKTAPLASLDYFRCPICLFKHRSRLVMKKHLANHYHSNDISMNPVYQCNVCGYKAGWQFTVKKHIIACHVANPNAAVVRILPKKQQQKNALKNKNRVLRLAALQQTNGHRKASNDIEETVVAASSVAVNNNNQETTMKNPIINGGGEVEEEDVEEYERPPEVVTKCEYNELNESEVYPQANRANMSYTMGVGSESEVPKKVESIMLTDFEGVRFEATYLVSNGPGTGSGGSNLNYSLNGGASLKKKMFYCETCPYKTNNYCNLKQHLLQHRFRDGFFKCRYCPYFVSMIRLLKQHEVLHEEYVPREGPISKPIPSSASPFSVSGGGGLQQRSASSVYSFPKCN